MPASPTRGSAVDRIVSSELPPGDFSELAQRMSALHRCERLWAAELADAIDRADSLAVHLDHERGENGRLTAERDQALAEADAVRSSYEHSLSWQVTRPFRWASRRIRHRDA